MKPARLILPLALLAPLLWGCAAPRPPALTVFAAASLAEAFTDLGRQLETARPGVRVEFNFAGSQQLRAQLEQGARADVFASANEGEMEAAIRAGLVESGSAQTFAHNRLVVILAPGNPGGIVQLADLARPGVKLDLADARVPAGQYTLEVLDRLGADPAFGADFRARALANAVSFEGNVRAVVNKVRLGEVDAGVVYSSDAPSAGGEGIVGRLEVPERFNVIASYPIATLSGAAQPGAAAQFVAFVLSPQGQAALARYGFLPAGAP